MVATTAATHKQQSVKEMKKSGDGKTSSASSGATNNSRGVVYLARIPHGFYEDEMRAYFTQFGTVTRIRLSRNKRTGKSKHYAFIEFDGEEVAKIVAETMDNYLLFKHVLSCKFIPAEKVHPDTFKGCEKKFKVIPWNKIHRQRLNAEKSPEEFKQHINRLKKNDEKKKALLESLNIDYDFPGYTKAAETAKPVEIETNSE